MDNVKWIRRMYLRPSTKAYDIEMYVCPKCQYEGSYDTETAISTQDFKFCPMCGNPNRVAVEDEELILHSSNGLDYKVIIENYNPFRPPEMAYAVDLIDPNGVSYLEDKGDYYFCGQDFIDKCKKNKGE